MKRGPLVLGSADGLTLILGLICGLARDPHALVHAAVSGGLAELAGMTAALWLSDDGSGFVPALGCGVATLAACAVPAAPYLIASGAAALIPSLLLVAVIAGVVARLRPERGVLAVAETYGVLVCAALLCFAASFI